MLGIAPGVGQFVVAVAADVVTAESRRGTEVAATMYTVIGTAKLHDIDPAAYLYAAIVAGDRGELLLPEQFAASQNRTATL